MRIRRIVALMLAAGVLTIGSAPAFGAEQHPPKFGPHDTQCQAGPDQPQCPGNH
jgi:hypothetical protein